MAEHGDAPRGERPRLQLKPRDPEAAKKLELERLHSGGKKVGRGGARGRPGTRQITTRGVPARPPPGMAPRPWRGARGLRPAAAPAGGRRVAPAAVHAAGRGAPRRARARVRAIAAGAAASAAPLPLRSGLHSTCAPQPRPHGAPVCWRAIGTAACAPRPVAPAAQNPFGEAKPREAVLSTRLGKSEEEILKEEIKSERPKVGYRGRHVSVWGGVCGGGGRTEPGVPSRAADARPSPPLPCSCA
jgi:hypothetical protein